MCTTMIRSSLYAQENLLTLFSTKIQAAIFSFELWKLFTSHFIENIAASWSVFLYRDG